MKKRVWPTIIAIVVIALVGTIAVSVIYYRFTSANRDPTMTGCVILRRDSIVFIYVDSDTMWDGVWTIDSNNVTFISHDDSITTVNDLYPGMMVQVLCYDEVIDAIFPTPLHDVAYIETWGEYNFDLYNDGVKILNGVQ